VDYSIRIGYWYSKSFWYLIVIVTCDKFSHENVGYSGDELKQFVNDERMRMDKEKELERQRKEAEAEKAIERKEKEKEAEIERKQK